MSERVGKTSRINWTRYWCPRTGAYHLTDDGFLDKDSENKFTSADAKSLTDLADAQCLVLLGSPGMGKTDEMKAAFEHDRDPKLFINLGGLDAARPLCATFSENPVLNQFASGTEAPTLWLDSLDEGVEEIANFTLLLTTELRKLKLALPQLRIRITCRIANWPESLELALQDLWSGESCKVYELLPLRAKDVRLAAEQHRVDFAAFLEAVRKAKAGPLAAKPITLLKMLLPEFNENGRLSGSQVEVYEKGCRRLAAEWSMGRQERSTSTNDDAETRFKAAQFVAAAMTFYGRNVLDCAPERHSVANEAVHSREIGLAGDAGTELSGILSIANVEAVAKTALMSGASSQHLYRFEHRTFQEFLAAQFLYSQRMPSPKVLTLFLNPNSPDRRVVPQLIETAAWLAALDPIFREALLEADPVAVLYSDVAAQNDATQHKLFTALCDGLRKGDISDNEWNGRRDLRGLQFEGISSQILAILGDTTQPEPVREFAIDVAWYAKVYEVFDRLADLALDTTRPLREREHCTYALAYGPDELVATRKAKTRLEPLLETTPADDPNDTLRGNALHATWRSLDPRKLFAVLRPHHNPDYLGAYWSALETIRRGLEARHVIDGLAWAERQPHAHTEERGLRQVMSRIFNLAWQNLDKPGVIDALARAAAARASFNEDVRLDDDGEEDYDRYNKRETDKPSELASSDPQITARRRRLCYAMVRQVAGQKSGEFWLGYYMQLAQPQDFEWLLEQHLASTDDAEREVWLDLAKRAWRGLPRQVEVAQRTSTQHESVREAFQKSIALLDPNSLESIANRKEYERYKQELREPRAKNTPAPLDPLPSQRIQTLLQDFENGNLNAWLEMWELMRVDDYGRYMHGHYFEPDITKLPFWQTATPETRARLVSAAETYARVAQEAPTVMTEGQPFQGASAAGLAALILLHSEKRNVFDALPFDAWARWPHIVLDFPNPGHDGIWAELASAGYKSAPESFRKAIEHLLKVQIQETHGAQVLWRLKPIWDEPLCAAVFEVVSKNTCSEAVLNQAMDLLLEHGHKPARDWCVARVEQASTTGQTAVPAVKAAVSALLLNRPATDEWNGLWRLLANPSHKDFALAVLGRDRHRRVDVCGELSEQQVADLYIWLRRNAPAVPEHHGMQTIGPAELLDDLKRIALNSLMQRGTAIAVEQCERIQEEFKDDRFPRVIIAAKAEARRKGSIPIRPQDLRRYVTNAKCRFVRGERELCNAVMDVLERINKDLQGENPSSPELWDVNVPDANKPKEERHFSSWLTRRLQEKLSQAGVFIGREIAVKLREQTDIQVIAKPVADEREFGIIIEVKGCWHKEVKAAMKTQLRDDYLKNHSFTHGIYVVGWYFCDGWTKGKDYHDGVFREQTRDEAQMFFEKQAESLSSSTVTIRAFVLNAILPS